MNRTYFFVKGRRELLRVSAEVALQVPGYSIVSGGDARARGTKKVKITVTF